jgi:nucleoid DNA-binding protein/cell division septation protein DedD
MSAQITSQTIWNSVKELLHKHDCVIMPNFGGFVCNPENARIDQVSHIITPPARRVMFNQNLKTNDGLLVQFVAQNFGITYSEALRVIDDLITDFKNKLEQTKQIDIDTFGTFRLNAEANYVFLPNKHNTYLYASFGLLPLQATPVADFITGAKRTRLFKDRKDIKPVGRKQKAKNIALKALTAVLVVMLGLNAYIFLTDSNLAGGAKINTTGIHSWFDSLMSNDNKPNEVVTPELSAKTEKDTETTYIPESPVVVEEEVLSEAPTEIETSTNTAENTTLNIAEVFAYSTKSAPNFGGYSFNEDGSLVESAPTEVTQPTVEETPMISPEPAIEVAVKESHGTSFSYHVIGGVFCNEANARKFYNMLKSKGFDAQLLLNKKINCNRVSYRKVSSREEALRLMDSIKSTENPEAWVLPVKE